MLCWKIHCTVYSKVLWWSCSCCVGGELFIFHWRKDVETEQIERFVGDSNIIHVSKSRPFWNKYLFRSMVWHSPTYSNDDILPTTIHQEPTIITFWLNLFRVLNNLDTGHYTLCLKIFYNL